MIIYYKVIKTLINTLKLVKVIINVVVIWRTEYKRPLIQAKKRKTELLVASTLAHFFLLCN